MQIYIPFRGFSVNSQFYANRKFGATKEFKEWSYQVNHILQNYSAEFEKLRDSFVETEHGLSVKMTFYYKNFFTSTGVISKKLFDLSNLEKSLLDLCVDKAHYGKAPYKSPNLCLNDANVIELISKKLPAYEDGCLVEISVIPLPQNSTPMPKP